MPGMTLVIVLLCLCYALAAIFRFMEKVRGVPMLGKHAIAATAIGLILHVGILLSQLQGSDSAARFSASFVTLLAAFTLIIACLFIEWLSREVYFSLFVLPLAIPMVATATLRTRILEGPEFAGPWFFLHIFGAISGECFFFLAALASATYLYLVRNLKQKNRSRALFFFPSLARLDALIATFTGTGLGLFFFGLMTGGIWSVNRYGTLAFRHPKILGSLVIFLLIGSLFGVRVGTGWAGPRWAWACLLSFCISLLLVFSIDGTMHWRP